MREIKFRGIDVETGKTVYGDFVHHVPMSSFNGIVDDDNLVHEIKPGSVAQLVGFDRDGNEVYEGDSVQFGCVIVPAKRKQNFPDTAKLIKEAKSWTHRNNAKKFR